MSNYRTDDSPVGEAEALTASCPDCGVKAGDPCVYPWPKTMTRDGAHNANQQARIDKVGTPTKKAHNGRRRAARDLRPKIKIEAKEIRVQLDADSLRVIYAALYQVAIDFDPDDDDNMDWLLSRFMTHVADEKIAPALWRLTGERP